MTEQYQQGVNDNANITARMQLEMSAHNSVITRRPDGNGSEWVKQHTTQLFNGL